MKILVFLDELYYKEDQGYYSMSRSGNFLLNLYKKHELVFSFPVASTHAQSVGRNTTISKDMQVIELPAWISLLEYLKNYHSNDLSIREKIYPLLKNVDAVWVRLPSMAGIAIASMAIRLGKTTLLHFAGDIRYAYQSPKYKGIKRIPAMIFGYWMHFMMRRLLASESHNVFPFCTGSVLEDAFSHRNTRFFLDSEIEHIQGSSIHNKCARHFLYVGRLQKEKGIELLVRVWRELENQELTLGIVGYGEMESFVKKHSEQDHRIKFFGYQPGEKLDLIYRKADCLIVPTMNSEGFPRVIAEAWSHGLAVISADVGGIKSFGKHGENVLYFTAGCAEKLKESIGMLIQNEELFQKIKNQASLTARYLTKSQMLQEVENVLAGCR